MATIFRSTAWLSARTRRALSENLTAYALLSPGLLLLFIFGVFPVGFAFYVSLYRWRRFPGEYLGLAQYERALGDAALILFFWISLGLFAWALWRIVTLWRTHHLRGVSALIPGVVGAAAVVLLTDWVFKLLPVILNIPQRIRGQERTQGLFLSELAASFAGPTVSAAGSAALIALLAALIIGVVWWRVARPAPEIYAKALTACTAIAGGALLFDLTLRTVNTAIAAAQADGAPLPIWTQIILISAGAGMIGLAYWLWRRASAADSGRWGMAGAGAALLLLAGGYIFVTQLPVALSGSDPELLSGFSVTIMFVLGTVPFQLAIGLGLAVLLFQKIKGKAFFRMMYFLPYITPFVATSIVFSILFSHRPESPINQFLVSLGIPIQKWLLEPTGIFRLIFGDGLPAALAGPSLALVVIMIYSVWTYIGYNAVVFLAGLGSISAELYEAARIDGANEWDLFRRITLPLLSPTTFFLSLIAIIGTFQAFTQIWIMRTPAAGRSVDTIGVTIFEIVRSTDPNMGYGSALSMVLFVVILLITIVQNRLQGRRVFYG
jgi:multiple sugar transport system permease protein